MRRRRPKQLELLPASRRPTAGELAPTDPQSQREVVQALAEMLLAVAIDATPADEEVGDESQDHR